MGDTGETYNAMRDEVKLGRELFGTPCPRCLVEQPNAEPTIMTPQRICKRHKKPVRDYRTWKQIAIELKLKKTPGS